MGEVISLAKTIMDPNHEMWAMFVAEMLQRIGDCDSTHKITRAILEEMRGINVDGTLEFFESQGGVCDCEVLLNVVAGNLPFIIQHAIMASLIEQAAALVQVKGQC